MQNIGGNFHDLGLGKEFFNMTLTAQFKKTQTDKLNFIQITSFCSLEDIMRMKRQVQADRKYL